MLFLLRRLHNQHVNGDVSCSCTVHGIPALAIQHFCASGELKPPLPPSSELSPSTQVILKKYCNKAEMGESILDVPLGGPGFSFMPYGFQLSQLLEPPTGAEGLSPREAWNSPKPSPPHTRASSCSSSVESEVLGYESNASSYDSSWEGSPSSSKGALSGRTVQRSSNAEDILSELLGGRA